MFENSNLFISFKYLEATSPKELERRMLQIQVDNKSAINFTSPTYNPKNNKYETWYLYDHSKDVRPQDKLKLGNK